MLKICSSQKRLPQNSATGNHRTNTHYIHTTCLRLKSCNVADQAERNLNSCEAKIGAHKTSTNDEIGVDTSVEKKFLGAKVKYDPNLSTNASYNKRIPPSEGSELDARGRQSTKWFEGNGGPVNKLVKLSEDYGG
ncbi:uncharacterized protein BCR38DRAFT_420592 [Pseudomassariella vexata]|uniref:Uncharacterized protein n=1 Tax=Pseudomassariella vexata TaxID=1141098 RepID=A0A1Y2EF01_9PEZI|nr:uncharacterized protein BCR38DRAFT_420592 [Pseudomassariella vexata]ORY69967.1 hypothetical protein BCR38DRAFT_420592 [Pseudomassariella vexata]